MSVGPSKSSIIKAPSAVFSFHFVLFFLFKENHSTFSPPLPAPFIDPYMDIIYKQYIYAYCLHIFIPDQMMGICYHIYGRIVLCFSTYRVFHLFWKRSVHEHCTEQKRIKPKVTDRAMSRDTVATCLCGSETVGTLQVPVINMYALTVRYDSVCGETHIHNQDLFLLFFVPNRSRAVCGEVSRFLAAK